MRLILFGAPGSGKGTQALLLSKRCDLTHLSTGDILRDAVRRRTPAGKQAEAFVRAGKLVPDDLVNEMVADCFRADPPPRRFVLDGYPRTVPQALFLDGVLNKQGLDIQAVVLLEVPDEEIVRRLSGRWVCPNKTCGAAYHLVSRPPKRPGICDLCGTKLVQREDDKEETVRKRLKLYHEYNGEMVKFYLERGLLHPVVGTDDVEVVHRNIVQVLSKAGATCQDPYPS
jgi:adenylate kinase